MRKFLMLAVLVITSTSVFADVACGTIADIIAGGGSCTVGDKTFSNFSVQGALGTTGSNISVTGLTTGDIGLLFSGFNLTVMGANQSADITIGFDVTTSGGLIKDASTIQSSSGATGSGAIIVTEGLCDPTTATCSTFTATFTQVTAGDFTLASNNVVFSPLGTVHATKDIGVFTGAAGGTASVSAVADRFSQVPEPATLSLLGLGLLALGKTISSRKRS